MTCKAYLWASDICFHAIHCNNRGDKAYLTREDAKPISSGILIIELNDTSSDFKTVSLWKETSNLSDITDFIICNRYLAQKLYVQAQFFDDQNYSKIRPFSYINHRHPKKINK